MPLSQPSKISFGSGFSGTMFPAFHSGSKRLASDVSKFLLFPIINAIYFHQLRESCEQYTAYD